MSVLVESPSLIVRRAALDVRYAGGMLGFLRDMELPEHRVLRTCVDSHLVCVSFLLAMHARRVANTLETLGFLHIVDGQCIELAIMGEESETAIHCAWMALGKHTNGYTHAWLAASDPGELSTAQGWDYERALRTETDQFGDDWRDCARISVDDGRETWLDYRTGEMETRQATHVEANNSCESAVEPVPRCEPLMPVVHATLIANNGSFYMLDPVTVCFTGHGPAGFYWHRIIVYDERPALGFICTLGSHVPEGQRGAVGELLALLNECSSECEFVIDEENGWVSVVTLRQIDRPVCTTSEVEVMWAGVRDFAAAHHAAIMRVAFGGMSPYEFAAGPWSPDKP